MKVYWGFLFVFCGRVVGFVWFDFQNRVSLCSSGCPGTCSVDQASLELTEIFLPVPLQC
ncbi:hypothetical protein I79_001261 [Cricetulus griseus]|uniref:Uncharacterized protein n=1 Tax=Cricetulus griseus TaxID=10029 RepID=G3GUA7_CRIGR|nr:hypothetical protein I79_001261 [Cricetulus griseus]